MSRLSSPAVFPTNRQTENTMRTDIHPEYKKTLITCACGRVSETQSTVEELHVEICSHCHPFFTGRQKLVDTAGRVERFRAKYGAGSGRVPAALEEPARRGIIIAPADVEVREPEAVEQEPETEREAASEAEPTAEVVEADEAAADEAAEPEAVAEPEAEAADELEAALEAQASDEQAAVTEPPAADEPEESAEPDEAESEKS